MTADRVIVLVVIVVGIAVVAAFNRRKLARMNSAERARFDRNVSPVSGLLKAFMWFWVIASVGAGLAAAVNGVWPISVALFVIAAGIGFGVAYRSRWWIGS
jgi:hypothetical protein